MSNPNKTSPIGNLLMLPQTDRWSSEITERVSNGPIQVRLFESAHSLAQRLDSYPSCLVVIEICESALAAVEGLHAVFDPRFHSVPKLAVGGFETRPFHLQLVQVGFAEAFHSTADVDRLLQLAASYFGNRPDSQLSIEQKVDRDMPWAPIPE